MIPVGVLKVTGKVALLAAVRVYRDESTATLIEDDQTSRYHRRKLSEVRWELQRRNVITESLEMLETEREDRVALPRDCDYQSLSYAGLKTLIACYARARYSRESFRFTCTQDQLAKNAGLSPFRLRGALRQLESKELIATEKLWREGTRIMLLDPETRSGCPLYYLRQLYAERLDAIPVHDRYKTCLAQYDRRGHLGNIREPVSNYQVVCPFCTRPDPKGSMRINTGEDNDGWFCFKCKRSGNSARLWARLQWRIGKEDWRSVLNALPGATGMGLGLEETA